MSSRPASVSGRARSSRAESRSLRLAPRSDHAGAAPPGEPAPAASVAAGALLVQIRLGEGQSWATLAAVEGGQRAAACVAALISTLREVRGDLPVRVRVISRRVLRTQGGEIAVARAARDLSTGAERDGLP